MTKLTSRCQLTDFPQDPAFQDLVYLLTLSAELTQLPDEKNRKRAEALFDIAEHRFDDAVIQRALTLIQQGCIQNIKPKNDIPQQSVRQSNLSSQDEVEVKKEEQTTVYESSALDNILWWLAEQDFSFLLPSLFTVQFGPRISSRTTETEQKQGLLRNRLQPVMQEVPVNPSKDEVGYGGSPFAQEIEGKTQRVRALNRELSFILDSLQL